MNELQMTIAVKLIEAQKRVAEHDIAEKARIKEQKEIRKTLYKKVTDLQQMYDSGVLQDDLFQSPFGSKQNISETTTKTTNQ